MIEDHERELRRLRLINDKLSVELLKLQKDKAFLLGEVKRCIDRIANR